MAAALPVAATLVVVPLVVGSHTPAASEVALTLAAAVTSEAAASEAVTLVVAASEAAVTLVAEAATVAAVPLSTFMECRKAGALPVKR